MSRKYKFHDNDKFYISEAQADACDKKEDQNTILEVGPTQSNFQKRLFGTFKNYLIFLPLGLILYFLYKPYSNYLIAVILFMLVLFFIFSFLTNLNFLCKVKYHVASDHIEIVSARLNHTNKTISVKRSDVEILVRKSYRYRYPLWKIQFYHNKKIIVSQLEVSGWTEEMFVKIKSFGKR